MAERDEHSDLTACRHVDRRSTLKALALTGVALVAGFGVATPAQALAQEGWRWCWRCQVMFYGTNAGGQGRCPGNGGGGHDAYYSNRYFTRVEGELPSPQENGWRWCRNCMGLFYSAGARNAGLCPNGGAHDSYGSFLYAAILGEDGPSLQGGWRKCRNCLGMFYKHLGGGGVCPIGPGRRHDDTGSSNYACLY